MTEWELALALASVSASASASVSVSELEPALVSEPAPVSELALVPALALAWVSEPELGSRQPPSPNMICRNRMRDLSAKLRRHSIRRRC
ncbi:hypothetical protein [Paraburkholderia aspalathi]|uniref:hypothetical protein n=1 Tax=Paraburkholderia aspalathi TaxID=1324617 RepID=UPI001FD0A1FA|nr:hypothetical protein [Paraburkholderia aspalathi]